jgi:hypothetical protein
MLWIWDILGVGLGNIIARISRLEDSLTCACVGFLDVVFMLMDDDILSLSPSASTSPGLTTTSLVVSTSFSLNTTDIDLLSRQ